MLRVQMKREDEAIVFGQLRPRPRHRAIDLLAIGVAQELELGTGIERGGAELVEIDGLLRVACLLECLAHADDADEGTERTATVEREDRAAAREQCDARALGCFGGDIGAVAAPAKMSFGRGKQELELGDRTRTAEPCCERDEHVRGISHDQRHDLLGRGKDVGKRLDNSLDLHVCLER